MSEFNKISEFVVGERALGFYLLKSIDFKSSSKGGLYIDATLADSSGTVNAKHWRPTPDMESTYKSGDIVKISAEVREYNGHVQLSIEKIRLPIEDDDFKISEIVPAAPIPAEKMYEEIMGYIDKIETPDLQLITRRIYEIYKEQLMYYPAAKVNHHAIMSGLLYHVLRMLRTAEGICDVYENLNRDLVYAGIALHDIQKISEMSSDQYGVVSGYTKEGIMLGHIVMGVREIDRIGRELGISDENSVLLQHLILTHHYHPEFGSPKKPMIPEGEVLHLVDMLDARIYDMELAVKNVKPGDFSSPVFVLDRRRIYKQEDS